MILIDAIHINNGGGKVLLDYLIDKLENTGTSIFYLLDQRIKDAPYTFKSGNTVEYLPPSLWKRYQFYQKHKNTFSKIFVLGNVPPMIKMNAEVYTYFHNSIYIEVPSDFNWKEKVKYKLKVAIIRLTGKNTNFWLVQSQTLKDQFVSKFGQESKVSILPFFRELLPLKHLERSQDTFFYASNAQENKNHIRLIRGFCKAYDMTRKGKLIVTVSPNYPQIIEEIKRNRDNGYPIENIGFVDKATLIKTYQESEYVIFPSLAESFGLGLIEGISLGCKIIGADLPYTYAVCKPSLVFNPMSIESISHAIQKALKEELPVSESRVENHIDKLMGLLSS